MSDGQHARHHLSLVVNRVLRHADVEPRLLLSDFLRDSLGLRSVHLGCEHGVCGACTVLMNGQSIRSCITLALQANDAEIMTVEGLSEGGTLHPIQEAFWEKQGLQCGFCTPGMVLRAYEILSSNPNPSAGEVREGISGNLCRCTGYQFIVEAVLDAAERIGHPAGAHASPPAPVDTSTGGPAR